MNQPTHNTFQTYNRNIIVIGASAGGIEAILKLTSDLPADIPAAIFIAHHLPAHTESNLFHMINRHSAVPAVQAQDGVTFEMGKIYCVRRDKHMLLEDGKIMLSKGPRENRFRPSIDVLFRSAAYECRDRVIGVILSGALNDGTAGMCNIKRFGGLCVIQNPKDAAYDSMPIEVSKYTDVDYTMNADELGDLLGKLTLEQVKKPVERMPHYEELIELEVKIAKNDNALVAGVFERGIHTPLTCPDCHGAVIQYRDGNLIRFRCHTGHSFTPDALLYGITENVEKDLWQVMRGMEENNFVLRTLGNRLKEVGQVNEANKFFDKAEVIIHKSRKIHQLLEEVKILSKDSVLTFLFLGFELFF